MRKGGDAWRLTARIMRRSRCRVRMGAVVTDRRGIVAWGWNHAGADGRGMCAERHALGRANPKRLRGAEMLIRGSHGRAESGSKPCRKCREALAKAGVGRVHYLDDAKVRTTARVDAL